MENKKSYNGTLYLLVVIISIVVYLVIRLEYNSFMNNIDRENQEYANNIKKQPANNIITVKVDEEPILVNKINLNVNKLTMTIGSKRRIIAIIEPYNATNNILVWESSDPSIVMVDSDGNIVALKEGKVTITVRTNDGTVMETCTIKVEPVKVDKIILNPTTLSLKVNTSANIVAVIKPDNATIDELIWSSSDPSIAKVDNNGRVYGVKAGSATITAKTPDGKVKSTCVVNVVNDTIPINGIKIEPSNVSIKIGSSSQLLINLEPENTTERDVIWTSSDPSIATVDSNGKITGVNTGTVTITVKTPDGKIVSECIVTVEPIEVEEILLNTKEVTLKVGESEKIVAIITPTDATNKDLIWTSSDPSIAAVDNTGKVTGIKEGTVTITVKTPDGKVETTFIVKVEDEKIDDTIIFSYDYDEGNYIYLINQFPIKDEVGKSLQGDKHTQDFKLKFNEQAVGVKYVITAEKLDGSDLDEKWAKLFLVNDGVDVENCYRSSNRIKTFDEYQKYNGKNDEKIIYEGVITSSEASRGYKDFTLRMWISEDLKLVNSDYLSEEKTFKVRVNVYATK